MSERVRGKPFSAGSERAREAGRKGGQVRAAQLRRTDGPYQGTILDVLKAAGLTGPTWAAWHSFWRAVFALPMGEEDLAVYRRHTDRETPPTDPVAEAWMPIGRRGGKSHNAAAGGLFLAIRFDASVLSPGELGVVPIIAADRRQARAVFGYLKALCDLPEFRPFVHRVLKESIEFHNGVNVEIHTASYRTTRGFTVAGLVCDEISFWRTDDGSANPDTEVLNALRPGMATVPNALLLGLSSPYAAKGELFKRYERSFGRDDPRVLVWNADTRSMNPVVPQAVIDQAFEDDPASAASEYGRDGRVTFRKDVEALLDLEAVRAVTAEGRRELPPQPARRFEYRAFVDPSGGSQDSFTLAIAHQENGVGVLDLVRETRPPFSPDEVVRDFAATLKAYGLSSVTGDRYAGEWPRERFRVHGITYTPSELTKSEIYRETVAPVNAGRVALLDLPVLRAQLVGLERKVSRGGRDSIDHAPGGRDDVANAAAGALVLVLGARGASTLEPFISTSSYSPGNGVCVPVDQRTHDPYSPW